jgi:hypothetical protein
MLAVLVLEVRISACKTNAKGADERAPEAPDPPQKRKEK